MLIVRMLCIHVPPLLIVKSRDSMATTNGNESDPTLIVHSAASIDQLQSLPMRMLCSHLPAHSLNTSGNKAT